MKKLRNFYIYDMVKNKLGMEFYFAAESSIEVFMYAKIKLSIPLRVSELQNLEKSAVCCGKFIMPRKEYLNSSKIIFICF